jgi:hypothetical protein
MLTPAEQHLVDVICQDAPRFAWRSASLVAARARRAYAVGLVAAGAALLLTIAVYGHDQIPPAWLHCVAVCLAIKAAGVNAGRVAAGLGWVAYLALLVMPHHAGLWAALGEPRSWYLAGILASILFCTTPRPRLGDYGRRMRRIIASISAKISVSSPRGLPDWRRSISTS